MSKAQVRFALGTPLVVDPFHSDRWDYVYMMEKRGRVIEQRRIVVLFDQDKLLRIEGDVVPADANAAVAPSSSPPAAERAAPAANVTTSPAPTGSDSPGTTGSPVPEPNAGAVGGATPPASGSADAR
jgi:outer membrane protein assembly factor BamE